LCKAAILTFSNSQGVSRKSGLTIFQIVMLECRLAGAIIRSVDATRINGAMREMSNMKRVLSIAVGVIVIVAAFSTAIVLRFLRDQSLTRLQQEGTIRIGYAVEAPYAFLKPGGEVTGESPKVAKQIVARPGIRRIEWRQSEFGSLISGLESGRFDVIAAGMFITPERAQRVSFSEPTFHVQQGLLVPKRATMRGVRPSRSSSRKTISSFGFSLNCFYVAEFRLQVTSHAKSPPS
jgi:Bacterial extracellular solute-binding proteins, family 3